MIRDACDLSKAATWRDFLVWYGNMVGTMQEAELVAETKTTDCAETRLMAGAELRRRAALEAA